jgi:hypothetical protein
MHFSFLVLLAITAVTALAAPVPGEPDGVGSDEVGKSTGDAEAGGFNEVESLFQCAWRYQHLETHERMPNIKKCIDEARRAAAKKIPQQETNDEFAKGSESVTGNPSTLMTALNRLPGLSRIAKSMERVRARPLGAPSIPGAFRPFPI